MIDTVYVYALVDPDTGEHRYVGCTSKQPADRLKGHLWETTNKRPSVNPKDLWVRSLKTRGLAPEMVVLEQAPRGTGWEREKAWIAECRSVGCALLNVMEPVWTAGGF